MLRTDDCPLIGLDIGSTTVKLAVLDPQTHKILFSDYRRHGSRQVETTMDLCRELAARWPAPSFRLAVCGSGGKDVADAFGVPYVQEVVANSIAIRSLYPQVRTAIELGGQDAKIIFFHRDGQGRLSASDMRMNGVCAGGTGAFIDEVATLLDIPVESFDARAAKGEFVHDISGRCGVFAKTDIQPLLNQGVGKDDLALSTLHAIAKQTIGGLAQGLEIHSPVIFVGGPLSFNPTLVRVFAERLGLGSGGVVMPEDPCTLVATGAALSLINQPSQALRLADLPGRLQKVSVARQGSGSLGQVFFDSPAAQQDFLSRHDRLGTSSRAMQTKPKAASTRITKPAPTATDLYIGLDGGSTTGKCVALNADNQVLGTWYAHNRGKPIEVMVRLLAEMAGDLRSAGIAPVVRSLGTTGYAEALFATAFHADYHTVETVAHATAARHFFPEASFILDIGGQDMKAIFLDGEVVTGIVLNEACSAGCGSFLENFASSLGIPVEDIANRAFAARNPSVLGSRCTVFMNSSIISEQRNGKTPDEIMAGLCRSVIENVFSKVVRLPNLNALGQFVVVQGGTFRNDAVLRAMEQYLGRPVTRAPYPGEMGAIGVAILARQHQAASNPSRFIGFEALRDFRYTQKSGQVCQLCTNNCNRTVVEFTDGSVHVTGNRCERGEQLQASPQAAASNDSAAKQASRTARAQRSAAVPNLMRERETLLLRDWPFRSLAPAKDLVIGLPRVLEFWNSLPFWKAFFGSLGFGVRVSERSNPKLYQDGLANVPSDTVCFPAKLAHGHVKNLIAAGVDRIFMPMQNRMPPENPSTTGNHVCAVVKGYPLVIAYSDDPQRRSNIPFDHPMFHWFDETSRARQLCDWMAQSFGLPDSLVLAAIAQGDQAQTAFQSALLARGREVLDGLAEAATDPSLGAIDPSGVGASTKPTPFAIVLAGRPYHSDFLVNHDIDRLFTKQGIPVLPIDALEGLDSLDLSATRVEITTPFHTRMYAAALTVARDPRLEMVQLVSFGCGHDAVISDEVQSLMRQVAGKTPLILKLDESEVSGPLSIRVRSFVETVLTRRNGQTYSIKALADPFKVKFTKAAKATKTILIPNITEALSKMLESAMASEGYRVEVLPLADRAAIALGKQYVHNDMCYPAQVNMGEMLGALRSGRYDPDKVVCGLAKSECDCRLAHYAALGRKALDEAGYPQVPIITTDRDNKGMHPAFALGMKFQLRAMWGLNMGDVLEHVRRRLRPYELVPGQTEEIFQDSVRRIAAALRRSIRAAVREFDAAMDNFAAMPANLSKRRPRVFVIGEFLLNFHAGSNNYLEKYLEDHDMEVVLPDAFAPMHRDFMKKDAEARLFYVKYPFLDMFANNVTITLIDQVKRAMNKRLKKLPFMQLPISLRELAAVGDTVVHHTFTPGEGWLIAAEILHNADLGIQNFVILQPFGCLPNHIVGRGLVKKIKELRPGIQILPLDFDPDTSVANIENRLQMLIINARESAQSAASSTHY